MAYSNITNVKLETCCHQAIAEINNKLKLGNILQYGLCTAALSNIFGPSPHSINTMVSIQQTDYYTLGEAVKAMADVSQKACRTISEQQWFKHNGNPKLGQFWKGMIDAFS